MRRPWNITNSTVYSLATYGDQCMNMNICTYVTGISRKPKLYAIAIEHDSRTLELLENSNQAVLQILAPNQESLIHPLGKKSGKKYNKQLYLERKQLLTQWHGYTVLREAAGYFLLKKQQEITTGDHQLFIFEVERFKTNIEQTLQFQTIVEKGLIL